MFHLRVTKKAPKQSTVDYSDYVNNVFKQEWGIGHYDVMVVSHFVINLLFKNGKSVDILRETEFIRQVKEGEFSEEEISAYIRLLILPERPKHLTTTKRVSEGRSLSLAVQPSPFLHNETPCEIFKGW